ncbi:MAG: putative ferredoxin-NAD(+) reductase [Parcubacteria group bacterium Gr01-1014_2]|nr:MAG: putative ferredoxin-NAD(+) reductase [Parcubacteria group bacterium Gr01-1014_2]
MQKVEGSNPSVRIWNFGQLVQWQNIRLTSGRSQVQSLHCPLIMYLVKLLAKKEVAEKTTAFFFEKPKGFKFVPGQFIEIYLAKTLTHEFSIASSPKEKELMIATRMRPSAFKKSLNKLKIGNQAKIGGPFGQFVLHKNKKIPAVFLAGGIGITPFRSMIKDHLNRKITLFYSNRREKDATFLEELKTLQNRNFKLTPLMTKKNGKHIDQKMIKDNVNGWQKTIYYAVGSTGFVQSMVNMLSEMKMKPEQIKTENFSGY